MTPLQMHRGRVAPEVGKMLSDLYGRVDCAAVYCRCIQNKVWVGGHP